MQDRIKNRMDTRTETLTAPPAAEEALHDVMRDYLEVARRLAATHETLQCEVVRLRQELASKDRELERRRRLAALGELAAGVAHEVRNPLAAIQLYSGLLRRRFEDGADVELLEKIDAGIRAIEGVVQDTLSLTPRSGRLAIISVHRLVEDAHDFVVETLLRRQVTCERAYPERSVCVLADEGAMRRVLINLIANAAEASPPRESVTVKVTDERDGYVHITVRDRGPGLTDEVLDKLFHPFFTTKAHGTGLGLAIAHRLVEAHGGRLTAGNRRTGGARFELLLPTHHPDQDQGADAGEQTSAA